jgi:hypothetical protein
VTGIERLTVEAAAVAGLAVLLAVIVLATATMVMLRRVWRRWHALRHPFRGYLNGSRPRSLALAIDRRRLAATSASVATTVVSARWWANQRDQRRMWRAVTAAQHTVAVARRAGAPVGDLPTLACGLHSAARSVEALARAEARGPRGGAPASTEVRRLEEAAVQIHQAAIDSLRAVATADLDPLLPSVRLEARAVAAGIRAVGILRRPAI